MDMTVPTVYRSLGQFSPANMLRVPVLYISVRVLYGVFHKRHSGHSFEDISFSSNDATKSPHFLTNDSLNQQPFSNVLVKYNLRRRDRTSEISFLFLEFRRCTPILHSPISSFSYGSSVVDANLLIRVFRNCQEITSLWVITGRSIHHQPANPFSQRSLSNSLCRSARRRPRML